MRNRAIRPVATLLSLVLLATVPAQAGPIPFRDVVQVFGGLHGGGGQTQELRLRSVSQSGGAPVSGSVTVSTANGSTQQQQDGGTAGSGTTTAAPSSLISTTAGPQEGGQQGNVEVIDEGDVTGTVCDCGEILVPGGFKFPWLALAGIPLVCLTGICTSDNPPCTSNCGDTPIPEPTTLLLLSSGLAALGAGARRRYRLHRTVGESTPTTEV